ncbi:hypothetical protein CFOL_v3_10273, partial [Cephalotus follicularis]
DGLLTFHIAATFGQIKNMEEMILCCPDIAESTDKKGHDALHVAIIKDQGKTVKYFSKTASLASIINEQDEEGNSAMLAFLFSCKDSVLLGENQGPTVLSNQSRLE